MDNSDNAVRIFKDIASAKKTRPKAPPTYRRKVAVIIGTVLGVAYACISQLPDSILAPSVPFAHHPFGTVGNMLFSLLGIILVCLVCALPENEYRGALFASITAILILESRAWFLGSGGLLGQVPLARVGLAAIAFILGLGLSLGFMLMLRWAIDIQHELYGQGFWSWYRLRLPIALLIAVSVLAMLSIYPDDVRQDMIQMTQMIAEARAAPGPSALPAPLTEANGVRDFLGNSKAAYTLEAGDASLLDQDLPPELRDAAVLIVARFRGGWTVACLFVANAQEPTCKSYDPGEAPPITGFGAASPQLASNQPL